MKNLIKLACLSLALHGAAASAQEWPSQPIRLVVNFAAGGAADQLARIVSPAISQDLGVPVVVENRPGAGGNIGADFVAKSKPDGNTLLLSSEGLFSTNSLIYKKMPFSPFDDLVPIGAVARVPFFLVVPAQSPIKSLADFSAVATSGGRPLTFGSPGNGSAPHIAGEMLTRSLGIRTTHVPYKGAAPALTDLLGGQIDFLFDPGIALDHVATGKLRALGVGSPTRHPNYPEIKTLEEQGLKDFDVDATFGIYAPKSVSAGVVERVTASLSKALRDPRYQAQILGIRSIPSYMGPDQLEKTNRAAYAKIKVFIEKSNIRLE